MIMSISILSVLNGFAITKECKPCRAALHECLPFMIVSGIDQAFAECPDLVAKVAKDKKIKIDLKSVRSNCARLVKEIEKLALLEIRKDVCSKCDTKTVENTIIKELRSFLKDKANVRRTALRQFADECSSRKSDSRVIEALLKSYNSELIAEAEALILSLKRA